jgi:hypothetical protein
MAVSGANTLNYYLIVKLGNEPNLKAMRMKDRTITGRSDSCEQADLLKTLRGAWEWTNNAFEMSGKKFVLLSPRTWKLNLLYDGVDDFYGVVALKGGAVAFYELFGMKSGGVKY